ncbi:MAG: hypothetical protein Q9219_003443 [cf. Caloplaca sp. 3 TL-2023]
MLPLGLLNAAQGHPMLVELKSGETLNGHLISCDTWMNLTLKEVVQTDPEGTSFFRLPEVYVRGNNVGTRGVLKRVSSNEKLKIESSRASRRLEAEVVAYNEAEATEGEVGRGGERADEAEVGEVERPESKLGANGSLRTNLQNKNSVMDHAISLLSLRSPKRGGLSAGHERVFQEHQDPPQRKTSESWIIKLQGHGRSHWAIFILHAEVYTQVSPDIAQAL